MLIKEYRIPMPLSVDEYRIAQLYMIQKKSRDESQGVGSGVEIIENAPYDDGPGGKGQYTQKVYYISQHIPGWMVSILPRNALVVYEEAWNAYPYTKTRYTCPFVDKFSIEIETRYFGDMGEQDNVFELSKPDLANRKVDFLDIVEEQPSEMKNNDDLKVYKSIKTTRGPLTNDWIKRCKATPTDPVMCAYKLCKVEFKYWGMQSKIERFIHDVALRKTMLKAHCQVWCWQDEWFGLNIDDIRQLEEETKQALAQKFGAQVEEEEETETNEGSMKAEDNKTDTSHDNTTKEMKLDNKPRKLLTQQNSKASLWSSKSNSTLHEDSETSSKYYVAKYNMQSIEQISVDSSEDEEYYDANDSFKDDHLMNLTRWNSLQDLLDKKHLSDEPQTNKGISSAGEGKPAESKTVDANSSIEILFLVLHAGILTDSSQIHDTSNSNANKQADVNTLQSSFLAVMKGHYQTSLDRVAFRLVSCPTAPSDAFNLVKSLSCSTSPCDAGVSSQLLSLFMTSSAVYQEQITQTTIACNHVFNQFLQSSDGNGFDGQVCVIADSIAGIFAFDLLSNASLSTSPDYLRRASYNKNSINESEPPSPVVVDHLDDGLYHRFNSMEDVLCPRVEEHRAHDKTLRSQPSIVSTERSIDLPNTTCKLDFDVSDLFMLGSPLGVVLAHRSVYHLCTDTLPSPNCRNVYNLFYPSDKTSCRLEPLVDLRFSHVSPVDIPRFMKYPYGDGHSLLINDAIFAHSEIFLVSEQEQAKVRRYSELSIASFSSSDPSFQLVNHLLTNWWGDKRLDYALYCPEGLSSFPSASLPHLFHGSFWESVDLAAFILQQVFEPPGASVNLKCGNVVPPFNLVFPREKWQRKRNAVKIRNMTPNHRAKDALALENDEQLVTAKFTYGPLDVVSLTGEKVDVYVNEMMPMCDWTLIGSQTTDSHGKISLTIPANKQLSLGIYPLKFVVRGDLTCADSYLAVIPRFTDCVVFSIDGSFAASVSIMGSDPKVQPGSVDVVRHWQEMGYLIVYVTARPDMQKHRVVTWLAQHNFPHGLVWFADGFTHDPLKQKTNWLRRLQTEYKMVFAAGYGSTKDINVYNHLDLQPEHIFIVGKTVKKLSNSCRFISDGYSTHLAELKSNEIKIFPANYNVQVVKNKGSFTLPKQTKTLQHLKNPKRSKTAERMRSMTFSKT